MAPGIELTTFVTSSPMLIELSPKTCMCHLICKVCSFLFIVLFTRFQIAKSPFIYYDTFSSFVCLSWLFILIFGAICDFSDLTTCLYIGGLLPGLLNDEIIAQTGVSCKSLIPQRSTWWKWLPRSCPQVLIFALLC